MYMYNHSQNTTNTYFTSTPGASPNGALINVVIPDSAYTCVMGHVVGSELSEYLDGVVVGYCSECKCRVILPRIPGGLFVKRLQSLVSSLLDPPPGSEVEMFAWVMNEVTEIDEGLRAEKESLDAAISLRAVLKTVIGERFDDRT